MENEIKTLQYATVNFAIKKTLGVTSQQYLYLDSIRVLQANPKYKGWAYASNKYYAEMFDMTVRGIQKMTDKMREKGLIESGSGSLRQLTQTAYEAMTYNKAMNKVHPSHEQSSPLDMNKVHPSHEQSSPNSNKDTYIDNERDKESKLPQSLMNQILINQKTLNSLAMASGGAGEALDFSKEADPIKALADKLEALKPQLGKYPAFGALGEAGKTEYLSNFAKDKALTHEWKNEKDLLSHLINLMKFHKPKLEEAKETRKPLAVFR
jgi:hypothetical protein